jgi:AraC-like DNA-binding protein
MDDLKKYWKMELLKNVRRAAVATGPQPTQVEGVSVLRWEAPIPKRRNRWIASAGLIVQGEKEIEVGEKSYHLTAMNFLASPFDLPVTSQIVKASRSKPFMVLTVKLDAVLLRECALQSKSRYEKTADYSIGAVAAKAGPELIEAFARLSRLINDPNHQLNLANTLIKEIYCHLLNGSTGNSIRQFIEKGTLMQKMLESILQMHADLESKLNISSLADAVHMSRSTFFRNFQKATAMSPIQYQKHLRLLEARRILLSGAETVETAGFRVGYKSTSQFSREYSRYFGNAPSSDIPNM